MRTLAESPDSTIVEEAETMPLQLEAQTALVADEIRAGGDAFDRLDSLRNLRMIGTWSRVGFMALGLYAYESSPVALDVVNPVANGILWGATAFGFYRDKQQARKRDFEEVKPLLIEQAKLSQFFEGEAINLYNDVTQDEPSLRLFWEGPNTAESFSNSKLRRRLEDLQQTAKAAKATDITVPLSVVEDFIPKEVKDAAVSETKWWLNTKQWEVASAMRRKFEVVSLTPAQLDTVAKEVAKNLPAHDLKIYMEILAKHAPSHPALKSYRPDIAEDTLDAKNLERRLSRILERRLDTVDIQRRLNTDDEEPFWERTKQHFQGVPVLDAKGNPIVTWRSQSNYTSIHTTVLLKEFGTSVEELSRLPDVASVTASNRVIELCELAAWLTLKGGIRQPLQIGPGGFKETDWRADLQTRVVRRVLRLADPAQRGADHIRVDGPKHQFRRAMGAILLASMSLALPLAAARAYENYRHPASAPGVSAADHDILPYTIRGTDIVVGGYNTAIEKALGLIPSPPPPDLSPIETALKYGGVSIGEGISDARIGNVKPEPSQPVWQITPHGDMSTEGYWAEQLFDINSAKGLAWFSDELSSHAYDETTLPVSDPDKTPTNYIDVNRTVFVQATNTGSTWEGKKTYLEISPGVFMVPIPVMQNTDVVEAAANGQPVKIMSLQDGTRALEVTASNQNVAISYRLVPSRNLVHTLRPLQTSTGTFMPHNQNDQVWEKFLGVSSLPDSSQDRVELEKAALKDMNYRLAPIDETGLGDEEGDVTSTVFAHRVLDSYQGNCNTANTLLAISNPELNYVTGYYNTNTPNQAKRGSFFLSSTEAHAWTVDPDGIIQDATPTQNPLPKEMAKLAESNASHLPKIPSPETPPSETLPFEIMGGTVLLAGAFFLAAGRKNIAIRHSRRRLRKLSPEHLAIAQQVTEYSLFADQTLDDKAFGEIKKRPVSKQRSLASFVSLLEGHTPEQQQQLFETARQQTSSHAAQRAIKRASKIGHWAQVGIIGARR